MNTFHDRRELDVRLCATCHELLPFQPDGTQTGVYCCGTYYHDSDCLNKSLEARGTTWEQHYDDDEECYYSEWEPELTEEIA